MKNRIRFAVTALAIILFAACFFVSCSDDVIVNKDNDHSYAEVLESNGAFVYNGQNYETLQGAIDAAAKAESQARAIDVQKEAITVTGNVKTREVVIPENAEILMNLKGFEVSFFDVQTNAITVGKNSSFAAFNGTLAMADKQEGLVAISAGGENSYIELDSLKINAAGQTALLLDAGSATALSKSVSVEGTVIARGGEANTKLAMENSLSDVKLRGASLIVEGSGSAVITENSGENEFVVSPTATVIDQTGTIDPKVIEDSICYIVRKGELLTFGSLREAVASLEYDNETIVFITTETSTATESFTLSRPATVELNGFSAGVNNIILADGANLTITGKAKNAKGTAYRSFAGTITSAEGAVASLVLNSVEMMGSVDISGSLTATETVFNSHLVANSGVSLENSEVKADLDIGSENGDVKLTNVTGKAGVISAPGKGKDVTIDNSKAKAALETGAIVADDIVAVKGNVDINVAVGDGVSGTSLKAQYATFEGAAVLEGKLTSADSVFEETIRAGEIEDEGSTFKADLSALKGNLVLTGSYLDKVKEITSAAGGNITIVKSSGSIGKIETQAPDTEAESEASGSVVVDNSESEKAIVIGDITAIGDITLTGNNKDATILTVTGSVSGKDFKAESCTFDSTGETATITASTVRVDCSVFADGDKKISKPFYSIETTGKDSEAAYSLAIYSSTGRLGALNAKDGSVFVEEGLSVLVTGSITAKDEIHTTVTKDIYLIVSGDIAGASLYANYTSVNGNVELSKNLNSGYSYFAGTVTAGTTVTDIDGTIFEKDITADGDITLTGSKFVTENEEKPAITSTAGNILMTKVTGTAGALEAVNVTINNDKATDTLTTGAITAADAVKVTGNSTYKVTVASVSGTSLNASYTTVEGVVSLTGSLTSVNSVFEKAISAATVVDNGSTFKSVVFTNAGGGDAKFTGSVFASTAVNVTSMSGNIEMTKVSGTSGQLHSAQGSVTIDNSEAKETLTTGAIKAKDAVSIKGKSSVINVVVEAIEEEEKWSVKASTLDTVYATVNGTVTLTGDMTSKKSVFNESIAADAVVDVDSSFYAAIVAGSDVTLTGSVFYNSAPVTSSGNILMTKVTGEVGTLTAAEGKSIEINNLEAGAALTTGNIEAGNKVVVKGGVAVTQRVTVDGTVNAVSLDATYAIIDDEVTLNGGGLIADYTRFTVNGDVVSAYAVDIKNSFVMGCISATENVTVENSEFDGAPDIASEAGDIEMTNVTGDVGTLTADGEGKNVTIANAKADGTLKTDNIKAGKDVSVTGAVTQRVTVDGTVRGINFNAVNTTVNGPVYLSGGLTSSNAVFNGTIHAATVIDSRSTFNADVRSIGDVTLSVSSFGANAADVLSFSGNIEMTRVTGTAGNVRTNGGSVTIDNTQAYGTLTTGTITATGAVSVTGRLYNNANSITVAGVSGASLDVVYVTLDGEVNLTGNLNSTNSVYTVNAKVSAYTVADTNSTVIGDITAEYDITFENSVFSATSDIVSKNGNIEMTKTTGAVGTITASAYGSDVTINNALATAEFTTGKISAGNAVSVTGNSDRKVTVAGVAGSTLDAVFAIFNGAIEVKNDVTLTNSEFADGASVTSLYGNIELTTVSGTAGALAATNVTIDNTQIKGTNTLTTGAITALEAVSVTGNAGHIVNVAGVLSSSLDAVYASFSGDISTSGEVTISESAFTSGNANIKSSLDNIVLTKVTGTAGTLTANGVTINNADVQLQGTVETSLTTGAIEAVGDVSVTGNSKHAVEVGGVSGSALDVTYAIVTGGVKLTGDLTAMNSGLEGIVGVSGDLTATDSAFLDAVSAATITAERGFFIRNTNVNSTTSITAISGDVTLTGSRLSGVNVVSRNGKIEMTNVINETINETLLPAGTLKASVVTIDNAQATGSLRTGAIEAVGGEVTVTGSSSHPVTVAGVTGNTLDAVYTIISGETKLSGDLTAMNSGFEDKVGVSGDLTASDSDFTGAVSASTITAERGSFAGVVTATTGDVKLSGTKFSSSSANVKSAFGNIEMTKVTGTAGSLTATNVTISNADATGKLSTGAIKAVGAVDLTGNSTYGVTAAGVSGSTLETTYATVTGAVGLSGALTSTDSVFYGNVSATVITDERGTFGGNENATITATTGDVTLTGSVFKGSGVTSSAGGILMTKVTGTAGALEAYSVTINNDQTSAALVTGAINSVGAVKVTGNSKYYVTVGGVKGTELEADYAVISGDIEVATGDVTLRDSKFDDNNAKVTSTLGNITMTKVTGTAGDLSAYVAVTIDNTKVLGTADTLSTGKIEANGAITLTGNDGHIVTVRNVNGQATMVADYVSVSEKTILYGDLTSSNSTFVGRVSAATIKDTRSEFSGAVYGVGDVKLTGSKFNSNVADVLSWTGDIVMTGVFGTAGSLTTYGDAKTITIDNSKSFAPLTTGAVRSASAVPGDVTVTGNAYFGAGNVKVGAISGKTVVVDYATVTGAITASGDVTLTDSVFDTEDGVTSTADSILMTNVTGRVGNLTASATGMDITINNAEAKASLTTGAITADDTVTVTGNAYRQVTVDGSITGTTLVANYARLTGSIDTKTSVTASNCTVGDGTTDDDVTSTTVSITGSRIKLDSLVADSVTITSPVLYDENSSSVSSIVAKDLSVTAENDKFSVGTVAASRMISIAGGTFTGAFTFSGSANSTISAGKFEGAFSHTGSAALTIDGTYSSTDGWDVVFDNLSITGGTAIIKSGKFMAKDADQLNNIGASISQTTSSDTKFVELVYTSNSIGSSYLNLNGSNVMKAVVNFGSPLLAAGKLEISYPNSVELRGKIQLNGSSGEVWSYGRKLNDKNGYSIVYEYDSTKRIDPSGTGPYIYEYPTT